MKRRKCVGCGQEFEPAYGRQVYHTKACRRKQTSARAGLPGRSPLERARAAGVEVELPRRFGPSPRRPWHRQKSEPNRPYECFWVYLSLGPTRTLKKLESVLGRAYSRVARWSAQWEWAKRAEEWDLEQDRLFREANAGSKLEMSGRQAKLGQRMQEVAGLALERCRLSGLRPVQAASLAKIGFEIERAARGEPSAIEEHRVPEELLHLHRATLSRMSDEDLGQAIARIERELSQLRSGPRAPAEREGVETPN